MRQQLKPVDWQSDSSCHFSAPYPKRYRDSSNGDNFFNLSVTDLQILTSKRFDEYPPPPPSFLYGSPAGGKVEC